MSKSKYPLHLAPVKRKAMSAARRLAFGRDELASAIRFLGDQPTADDLRRALAALPPAVCLPLGCLRCDGDVPVNDAGLVADRICRACADDYDRAVLERRARMRAARLDQKRAA